MLPRVPRAAELDLPSHCREAIHRPFIDHIALCRPVDALLDHSARCQRRFHPDFCSSDADVVLRSFEGTLYRIHSYTLRTTSGLFDTLFSLPQPAQSSTVKSSPSPDLEEIPLYEPDFVVERLLRLLCSVPVPTWQSYDEVDRILMTAEKWDTPGPIASIRAALTRPEFLCVDPLRLYVIASHFGWKEEAKLASTETLKRNLDDPESANTLARLSSKDLLRLLNLHRKRRDMFRKLLDSPERFTAGNSSSYHCTRCGLTELNNFTWREYKHRMVAEFERRPLGDTLGIVVGESAEWPEAKACWEARCLRDGCGVFNYDRLATLRQIRNCISILPLTIDDC